MSRPYNPDQEWHVGNQPDDVQEPEEPYEEFYEPEPDDYDYDKLADAYESKFGCSMNFYLDRLWTRTWQNVASDEVYNLVRIVVKPRLDLIQIVVQKEGQAATARRSYEVEKFLMEFVPVVVGLNFEATTAAAAKD